MKEKEYSKSLFSDFSLFISSLIIIVVVSMSFLFFYALKDFSREINTQNSNNNTSIATSIFQVISKSINDNNFDEISENTQSMIVNNIIAYIVIRDNTNNKVIYSTIDGINGETLNDEYSLFYYTDSNKNYQDTYFINGRKAKYLIYIGFYKESVFNKYLNFIKAQVGFFGFIFIILGFFFSKLMTNTVLKPFKSIINNVKQIADGNFSQRLSMSNYKELNELLIACNEMASNLQNIYSTLEMQVQQRTKELNDALQELKHTQALMLHSAKMKSLGELVAGLTHELNNPINFVYGNLVHLKNYSNDLIKLIDAFDNNSEELSTENQMRIKLIKDEIDYDFLKRDLPELLQSCHVGMERTKSLIMDLRNFARMNEDSIAAINVAKEIETTLNILNSKIGDNIKIHKDFENQNLLIDAYGGQLNQVFMNLIDNSIYALNGQGNIAIRTKSDDFNVIIEIEDDGSGIDEDSLEKIFEPFYTTKPVGNGTGLGLSICYQIIKNHKGTIEVFSKKDIGTKFVIKLPLVLENRV